MTKSCVNISEDMACIYFIAYILLLLLVLLLYVSSNNFRAGEAFVWSLQANTCCCYYYYNYCPMWILGL